MEKLEDGPLLASAEELVEKCALVLEELLPCTVASHLDAVVRMEFILAARTQEHLSNAAGDDYRATGAIVGRVVLAMLESGVVAGTPDPLHEAQRLMAVLDGLSLRLVLQPAWTAPEQGGGTLRRHLSSLLNV